MKSKIIARSNNELSYSEKRSLLTDDLNLKEYTDHPFLFMSRQSYTSSMTRSKLFELSLNVKGSIVECGVWKGNGIMQYLLLSSILEPYAFNRKIYGFDTFDGFTSISEKDHEVDESMFANTSYDILQSAIDLYDNDRAVNHISKCKLIKGDAVKTIPSFVNKHPELIISLLYLDFDLYEPTKIALEYLLPLVPKGGVVAFDEINYQRWSGETVAMKEYLDINKIQLRKFSFDPNPAYFIMGD